MTSLFTQNLASHKDLLRQRTEQIDRLNEQIREFSAMQKAELERLQETQARVKRRGERQAKLANLKRFSAERLSAMSPSSRQQLQTTSVAIGDADAVLIPEDLSSVLPSLPPPDVPISPGHRSVLTSALPPPAALRQRVHAYVSNNAQLQDQAEELRSRSSELESLYRRVVSLCTAVPEDKVDDALPNLVAAIESERGGMEGEGDVGRVRDFLRRVDGGQGVRIDA